MNIERLATIVLHNGKERAVQRFHPWVFSGAIKRIEGNPADGDWVDVVAVDGTWLAAGHFQEAGSISVRLLSFGKEELSDNFLLNRLRACLQVREGAGLANNPDTNAYRLVYGEGDFLPGLVIDIYNGNAVIQCHSAGMDRMAEKWAEALLELFGQNLHTIYKKGREKNQVVLRDEIFFKGNQEETMIMENGCQFLVNWKSGQKTGFFLDQRDNRNLIRNYASGRRVLNTFCYSGGFSVYALAAGATSVHSVDVSVKAIDWANENIKINGFSDRVHKSFVGDSMKFMLETDSDYDLIVLDPPAFAKHLSAKHNAIQGYRRLNEVAIRNIHQGGIIFTFSCSQVVDQQLFESTVCAAAISVGRKVRILHRLSQPADHPVSIFHPEGEYLKGLVLHIE